MEEDIIKKEAGISCVIIVFRYLGRVHKEVIKSFMPVNDEKCIQNISHKSCRAEITRNKNIVLDLRKIGCEEIDWFVVALDRGKWLVCVNTEINLHVT